MPLRKIQGSRRTPTTEYSYYYHWNDMWVEVNLHVGSFDNLQLFPYGSGMKKPGIVVSENDRPSTEYVPLGWGSR